MCTVTIIHVYCDYNTCSDYTLTKLFNTENVDSLQEFRINTKIHMKFIKYGNY